MRRIIAFVAVASQLFSPLFNFAPHQNPNVLSPSSVTKDDAERLKMELALLGIGFTGEVKHNLGVDSLVQKGLERKEGILTSDGAFLVKNAPNGRRGRSVQDKFIVADKEDGVFEKINWRDKTNNRPISRQAAERLKAKVFAHVAQQKELFVFDGFAVAHPEVQKRVRVINTNASQNLAISHLLIRPNSLNDVAHLPADLTIVSAPELKLDREKDGINSDAVILVDFKKGLVVIAGTPYDGEMKKSNFTYINYISMDGTDELPMHASASLAEDNRCVIFCGLSGTGKSTLSARRLRVVADDELVWHREKGVGNIEGGNYPKTENSGRHKEPELFDGIRDGAVVQNVPLMRVKNGDLVMWDKERKGLRRISKDKKETQKGKEEIAETAKNGGLIIENEKTGIVTLVEDGEMVIVDEAGGSVDFDKNQNLVIVDAAGNVLRKGGRVVLDYENKFLAPEEEAEGIENPNGRVSVPQQYLPKSVQNGLGGQPKAVFFLTSDVLGVLPPLSVLKDPKTIKFWYSMGYTAEAPGTEAGGSKEPKVKFSPLFGAPFFPRPVSEYANRFMELVAEHNVQVFLLNTGWSGGPFGVGNRMDLNSVTVPLRDVAMNGQLNLSDHNLEEHPIFKGLMVPKSVPIPIKDLDPKILNPRNTWNTPAKDGKPGYDAAAYDVAAKALQAKFEQNARDNGFAELIPGREDPLLAELAASPVAVSL